MQPVGLHHVAINVKDATAARRFYCDTLGLSPRDDRPDLGVDGAWLDAGGQQVHLVQAAPPDDVGQHFALQVHDLDQVIAELRAGGVEVSDAFVVGTGRQCFVRDPSGNTVELHQPAR